MHGARATHAENAPGDIRRANNNLSNGHVDRLFGLTINTVVGDFSYRFGVFFSGFAFLLLFVRLFMLFFIRVK